MIINRIKGKKEKENEAEIRVTTELESESIRLLELTREEHHKMQDYYATLPDSAENGDPDGEVRERIESMKRANSNVGRAYIQLIDMSDELGARWNDLMKSHRKRLIPLPSAPANTYIDQTESKSGHFAQGLSIYKLLLICFIGSFAGVVIELLWCLLKNGYIESRSGLVFGPFNLLYGAGTVALTIALYSFRNRGKWMSFVGGMLVGSIVEYACSWWQEVAFGSRSWDYSAMPFNINGRICLLYSVFWGFLSVLWVKSLYPWIAMLILKMPNRSGKIATWIITAFFIVNAILTCLAVYRWSARIGGAGDAGAFWSFFDRFFPSDKMVKVFPNMKFGG
ncbi:MAG: putative ABC transporter permease [Clostridiales bacterium]|nr:putative ABC transporter permease [Clostridiales bacterium]